MVATRSDSRVFGLFNRPSRNENEPAGRRVPGAARAPGIGHLHRQGVEVLEDGSVEYDVAEIVGPYTWSAIHHLVETFPCKHCSEEGTRLMHGLHDVVNVKLGKKVKYPKDLVFLAEQVDVALQKYSPPADGHFEAEIRRLARSAGMLSAKKAPESHVQPRKGVEPTSGTCAFTPGQLHQAGGSAAALHQVQQLAELEAEIDAVKESIRADPAGRLVKYVKRSGQFKGELIDFTKAQYRELIGKPPLPAIVNEAGRVPWELAIDVIASELGFRDDEALKVAAERVVGRQRELEELQFQRQVLLEQHPACGKVDNSLIACENFPERDCRFKVLGCGDDVDIVGVRHPSQWSIHKMVDGDTFPSEANLVAIERLAGEANRTMKIIGQFPDDPDVLSREFPRCGTAKAEQWERCVQEVKPEGSADSPFAVCTASVGCSPS